MRLWVEEREGHRAESRSPLERTPGVATRARLTSPVERTQAARRSFDPSLCGPADELPVRIAPPDGPHA